MTSTIEHHIPDLTKKVEPDYYAVYIRRGPKDQGRFLSHVYTSRGKQGALNAVRREGHKLPRWSYAVRIGKEGYYSSLRREFLA